MAQRLKLTRNQFAAFLKDFESIKQFELLFAQVNDLITTADGTDVAPEPPANASLTADYLDLSTAGPEALSAAGRLRWDRATQTLVVGLEGGADLHVGQEELQLVHNGSGATLAWGSVVYLLGHNGDRPSVGKAQANAEATSTGTIGLTAESIALGGTGYVTVSGLLESLNTTTDSEGHALSPGQALYVSATVAGGLTNVKPASPDQAVLVGFVVRVSSTSGSIFVQPGLVGTSSGGGGTPASSVVSETTFGLTPAVGTSTAYARADHTHGSPPALTGDVSSTSTGVTAIANNAVTLAKLQDISSARFIGRTSAGPGDPEQLTGTQATALLDVFTPTLNGLVPYSGGGTANFLRADGTWQPASGGGAVTIGASAADVLTASGNQIDALASGGGNLLTEAGDFLVQENGSRLLLTMATDDGIVFYDGSSAKLTYLAATAPLQIVGINLEHGTSGVAAATYGSATQTAQVTVDARGHVTSATNVTISGVTPSLHATTHQHGGGDEVATATAAANAIPKAGAGGQLAAGWMPALTGDVTTTAGAVATTIGNNKVTNAKLDDMPANTLKGNNTGSPADPIDLTATQATAMINTFTSSLKGLTPASGGGTSNYLRADGSWAVPPGTGGGGGTPASSVVSETAFGQSAAVGTSTDYARGDHTHGSPPALTGDVTSTTAGVTTIGVGVVSTNKLADNAVQFLKFQEVTGPVVIGRSTASFGPVTDLAVPTLRTMIGNVTTSNPGLVPTAPNVATQYLDGTGAFSRPPGELLAVTTYDTSTGGAYSTTAHPTNAATRTLLVELVGGGGGGRSATAAASQVVAGGGGGAGGFALWFGARPTTTTPFYYMVGGGGAANTGGTDSGFRQDSATTGTILATAKGGNAGGAAMTSGTAVATGVGGDGGTVGTGTETYAGAGGGAAIRLSGTVGVSGAGASSIFGGGGKSVLAGVAGVGGSAPGAGGSGGCANSATPQAGGAGAAGMVRIWEFS